MRAAALFCALTTLWSVAGAASPSPPPDTSLKGRSFLYAGEWDTRKPVQSMFLVKNGEVVWSYSIPSRLPNNGIQEFDDATLLPSGNVVFSRMSGAGEVTPDKQLVWDYPAPPGTEIHSAQSLPNGRVLIMRNGNPAYAMIINRRTGEVEKQVEIPTPVKGTHGQFRHIRMTRAGTLLIPHLGENKVVEYDLSGKAIWSVEALSPWSALRLENGNTLIGGDHSKYIREVNPKGETVWELTQKDVPDIQLFNTQTAERLPNGNTVICNWCAGGAKVEDWPKTVQAFEVTPQKQVVWRLSSWDKPDLGPATSIQILDNHSVTESESLGLIH